MRIDSPDPKPRSEGDYETRVTPGYGKPTGDIILDEDRALRLMWLDEADCDRLIKAAAEIREQVARYRAQMAVPHGRRYLYQGTCQLCGKPEDDELHDEDPPDEARAIADNRELGEPEGECLAQQPDGPGFGVGYVCTLASGHDGPHEAGGAGGAVYARWTDELADDAEFGREVQHVALDDGPDCGCGLGAARCRELEDGA